MQVMDASQMREVDEIKYVHRKSVLQAIIRKCLLISYILHFENMVKESLLFRSG